MFNKIVFSNYYLRKRRDLKKDGKASIKIDPQNPCIRSDCAYCHFKRYQLVTTLLDRLLVHNSVADIFTVLAQYQKYVVLKGTILIVKYQRNNCFTKLFSILCQKVFDSRKYLGKHFPLDQSFFLQFFNRSVSDLGIIPSRVLIRSLNRNLS